MTARLTTILVYGLPLLAGAVILFGAYVRLSDAGLGCPDWPGCYGRITVPETLSAHPLDQKMAQQRPLEIGKAWREMIHRYLASTLGADIVLLAILTWRNTSRNPRGNALACYLLVPLVIFQGLLGMWTVTLLLKPLVVTAHLFGGIATIALLWWNLLAYHGVSPAGRTSNEHIQPMLWFALAVLLLQVFLGGWTSTNYAALACTDFPTCQGRWWPSADFGEAFVLWRGLGVNYEFGVLETPARTAIHLAHRIGAAITAMTLLALVYKLLGESEKSVRRGGWCILALLVSQVSLGITNVAAGLPLAVAVSHNGVAVSLVLALITVLYLIRAPHRPAGTA